MRLPTGRLLKYAYDGADPSAPREDSASRADVSCPGTSCPTGWSCSEGACWKPVATEIAMSGGALRRWKSSNGIVNSVDPMFDGAPRRTMGIKERKVTQVDALGNPTSVSDTGAGYTDTMTYAPWFHWLASSSRTSGSAYAYTTDDTLLGDRTQFDFTMGGGTATQTVAYVSGSSRMSSWAFDYPDSWFAAVGAVDQRASFTYTPGGAISEIAWEQRPIGGSWTYQSTTSVAYDGAERMSSWDGNEYHYDDRNLRTRKVDDLGTITDFWYDDAGQLQAELGCDSTCVADEVRPLKEYVWLGGRPTTMIVSQLDDTGEASDAAVAIYDIHTSLLGEPLGVSNAAQTFEWGRDHEPYWEFDFSQPAVGTNLRFPGQYKDSETGLFYNWNRYYWPMVGRYTQREPNLSIPDWLLDQAADGRAGTPYGYAESNPVLYSDPDGREICSLEAGRKRPKWQRPPKKFDVKECVKAARDYEKKAAICRQYFNSDEAQRCWTTANATAVEWANACVWWAAAFAL